MKSLFQNAKKTTKMLDTRSPLNATISSLIPTVILLKNKESFYPNFRSRNSALASANASTNASRKNAQGGKPCSTRLPTHTSQHYQATLKSPYISRMNVVPLKFLKLTIPKIKQKFFPMIQIWTTCSVPWNRPFNATKIRKTKSNSKRWFSKRTSGGGSRLNSRSAMLRLEGRSRAVTCCSSSFKNKWRPTRSRKISSKKSGRLNSWQVVVPTWPQRKCLKWKNFRGIRKK